MPRSRAAAAYANYKPEEDGLIRAARAVQILDTLDSMDRRDDLHQLDRERLQFQIESEKQEQARFVESQRLAMEQSKRDQQKLDLSLREEQRRVEEERLKLWRETNAATAASAVAARIPKIDVDSPEGQQAFFDLMSYARDNYVSEDAVRSTFGPGLEQITRQRDRRAAKQAEALGAEGLELYDAFRKTGVDPDRASRLAIQSAKAQSTLAYWQEFAEKKGTAFIPDMTKIKKRVGGPDTVTVASNDFDATPYFYDMDALYSEITSKLSPELRKAAEAESKQSAANLDLTKANARKANVEASIAEVGAGIYEGALTPMGGKQSTEGD